MKITLDKNLLAKPSVLLIIFCFCFSAVTMDLWRRWHFDQNNFVWDVANYYSYLPAKFLNNNSFEFKNDVDNFLGTSPTGQRISRGTYGMALMYSPFFALGYKVASNSNEQLTGFSEGFATCLHWGSIFYSLLGLIFLRNFLVKFFSEKTTTLTLVVVFFGTMLFYYTYGDSEMPHGYLFFLISSFLLANYHWQKKPRILLSIIIGIVFGLMVLIRPTEILNGFIFLLWGVKNFGDFKLQLNKLAKNWKFIILMAIAFIVIWIPQFIFWKQYTGTYFYSSYAALGEKFYWGDPQIMNILFSYRKGWVTYTPLILLAFAGFFFMKNEVAGFRWGVLLVLILNVYILSCWWDWFFGGCFGARGFCQHIAFLALPIASICNYFVEGVSKIRIFPVLKLVFIVFVFSGICFNVGQSYQYTKGLIHYNSMTSESYWLVFGKYELSGTYNGRYWNALKEPDYPKLKSGENRNQ